MEFLLEIVLGSEVIVDIMRQNLNKRCVQKYKSETSEHGQLILQQSSQKAMCMRWFS